MDSVERVKKICKERKIPISRLEKECGFSNGYINSLTKGKFPYDKMVKIANYLHETVTFIADGKEEIDFVKYGEETAMLDDVALEYVKRISGLKKEDQKEVYDMLDKVMGIIAKNYSITEKEADTN